MERFVLTDAQWAKMEPHCLGKPTDPGRSGSDNRRFVEAVLWIARTGSPWRDLPLFFGNWNSVFKRYRDWVKAGVFVRLFEACSDEPDMEYAMVDATIVKVHRHGQGAKGERRTRRDRPLQGRHDDQNTRADRRARQSGSLRPAAPATVSIRSVSLR
jgi:transposase